jgi:hypothetical protein
VVTVLYDTSIAEGAPGNPGPQPLNTSSLPYGGHWYKVFQFGSMQTRLPAPPGPQAILPLARSLELQGDPNASSSYYENDDYLLQQGEPGVGSTPLLDLEALQGLIKLPPAGNNTSQDANVRHVYLCVGRLCTL